MDCVFCKIISGEFSSYKVYEDDKVLAFLDISKDVDGHTLVIPKAHYKNTLDCPEELFLHIMSVVKKISKHYVTNCGYEGVNILNANEEVAGQTVFHLHYHIFPRKTGDGANLWPHNDVSKASLEEMQQVLKY